MQIKNSGCHIVFIHVLILVGDFYALYIHPVVDT